MRENRGEQNAAQQISQILAQWKEAMETKNAARAVAFYADDAAMFTLAPPLGTKGMQQQALQAWFDTWKGGLEYEMRDAELVAGDDIAYCHSYTRMVGTKTSGEQNDVWFRATATLRKIDGQWKITHEHTSVPFHMDGSLKAALELQPPAGAQ
jgi:PhnB protein